MIFLFNRKITIIGFGGFITTPVLLISKIFNIFFLSFNKIFIHEQNIIYGLANKINYFLVKNAFVSFPKNNLSRKEIFVGNFFFDENKINLQGYLEHDKNKLQLQKIKFFIQIPKDNLEIYKKKYTNIIENSNCIFFSYKDNLNPKEYDFIISRSGSGSLNEILFYTNNAYFIPHLISRDQHQKYNLNYFTSRNMSLKKFTLPNKKNTIDQFFFNQLINPYSIEKIICYTTR